MRRPVPARIGSAKPRDPSKPSRQAGAIKAKPRERLDVALVGRGLVESREKAAKLIMAGAVTVDGRPIDKAGTVVGAGARLEVLVRPKFVSRGGEKLAHALDAFGVSPRARICLDVGASTGGFTQCLLERGAARVYAVDVGQGQLDQSLRADGRVVVMEKTNARQLTPAALPESPHLATLDVSFISLEKVLPAVFSTLTPTGEAVALLKPQFEVGKGEVGKGGVVRDAAQHKGAITRLARFCILHGWHVRGVTASPLKGPKGNREFFLHLTLTGRTATELDAMITRAVEEEPA